MIKQITTSELPIVQDLAKAIWPIAYKAILSKEQLNYMLNRFYSLEALKEQLEIKGHVFYIAEDENQKPLGFVSFELDCEPQKTKIHKIYVLPETQGTGLGKQLFHLVRDQAIKANQSAIFLNVNK